MVGRTTSDIVSDRGAAVAMGGALPGVVRAGSDGRPALRCRDRTLAGTTASDPGSFVLAVAAAEKDVLFDPDPATLWRTDHYRAHPVVLVRCGTDAGERIARLFERAWWDRATGAARAAWGVRP